MRSHSRRYVEIVQERTQGKIKCDGTNKNLYTYEDKSVVCYLKRVVDQQGTFFLRNQGCWGTHFPASPCEEGLDGNRYEHSLRTCRISAGLIEHSERARTYK